MKPGDAISTSEEINGNKIAAKTKFVSTEILDTAKFSSRYSHFVAIIKFILLGLAILLIGLAFVLPNLEKEEGFTLDYADLILSDDSLTMKNPQFVASDLSNQNYVVTADTASQKTATSSEITLENIQADITLKSGEWLSMSAPDGVINQDIGILQLFGEINIYSDSGDQFTLQSADINLKQRTIVSSNPVTGHGPLGEIRADRLVAEQLSGRLRFEGNVMLKIFPKTIN
jgi:lipopolysaccharide export system protein LptC